METLSRNRASSDVSETLPRNRASSDVAVLATLLRDGVAAADALDALDVDEVVAAAEAHGVVGLVRRALVQTHASKRSALLARLDGIVMADAARGAWRRQQATRVIKGLHRAGIGSLVFKGDALAHTHYPASYLRPRCDTDLLVRKDDVRRADAVLGSLGYRRPPMVARDLVHTQCAFEFTDGALTHFVDLHWAISSRPLFAAMATFDELARDARPVEPLGDCAFTPSPVWSLLLACMHRVAHHNDSPCLIWLYDLKLLSERLSRDEWALVWALASQREITEVCRAGLTAAAETVGVSAEVVAQVRHAAAPSRREPASAFLGGGTTLARQVVLDARAVPGVAGKIRLVASHVFPDPQYMREVFGVTSRAGLALAYARRATVGAWRLVAPAGGARE